MTSFRNCARQIINEVAWSYIDLFERARESERERERARERERERERARDDGRAAE